MPRSEPVSKSKETKNPGKKKTTGKKKASKSKAKKNANEDSSENSSDEDVEDSPDEVPPKKLKKENSKKKSTPILTGTRNYWVEYYDETQRRWICVDPLLKLVDALSDIEKKAVKPMLYVVAVDNEMGTREIAAKYSSEFLNSKFRKLRVDKEWLEKTFAKKLLKSDKSRALREDAEIRQRLRDLPMPSVVSEFKNHPLYALEKDLLKFEAIYPTDVETLGEIRGHKIYPRTSLHTLQGELNWIRLARTVKEGEKPYKVVKARPKVNIPKEKRVPLSLQVYGYWQTIPYTPPEVIDGVIPRNEFGNIYMYQDCMLPKDCVHLRLAGIHQVARRLGLEAVPAIIDWEFSGGGSHPVVDGCVVLEKDADTLQAAWNEYAKNKAEKEAMKAEKRVWDNWKKLIKGKLLLESMRSRFKPT